MFENVHSTWDKRKMLLSRNRGWRQPNIGQQSMMQDVSKVIFPHTLKTRSRHAFPTCTRVDQKVLKLVTYLLKYTSELYQTYTEFATTISWFISVVRMTHYARRYMTSSFDDVMQQWPGVKTSEIIFFQRSAITNIYVSRGSYFFEIMMVLT